MSWRGWLARLSGRGEATPGAAPERWVVLDVETTGLDPERDALLAIGAVALREGRIVPEDSLEITVRPPAVSERSNILIHGIGESAQRGGLAPAQACEQFLAFAGNSPLLAYHADFDRRFLQRTLREARGHRLDNPWLDIARLAPAADPQAHARDLDDWLGRYGIAVDQRHRAIDDTLATAMLLQCLMGRLAPADRTWAGLNRVTAQARWLKA